MDSQITKIPSICGNNYPGVGFQVDSGDSVRVAMAWPSGSAEGWRSLTMEVPKKLSLETELDGVSVETLLKAAGQLFGDNDVDGFKQFEQMLGDKLPSAVVRAFARYAPVDSTHAGSAETCRCEIEQFLDGDIPGNIDVSDIHQEKSIETMLSSAERAKNELRDALLGDEKSFISLLKEYGNDCALEYFDLFE